VYYPERVQGRVFQVDIVQGPSIASSCTAEGDGLTNSTAGKRAYFYIQSRDWDGLPIDNADDNYDIQFVGPAEGGPTGVVDSGSFAISAVHGSGGQYLAQYIPQLSGTYVLTITLRGEPISGSPWSMLCEPGEIDPVHCNHSISVLPMDLTAGITFFFTVTTKDMYANLIKDRRDNTTLNINATYTDHNDYLSPLPVPDLYDWRRIYGYDIAGLAIFNNLSNDHPHSTYTTQLTIFRAGTYSLDVMVNHRHIIGSPLPDQVKVRPALLYAPACIVYGLPLTMTAGSTYTFQIQTRDFYSNNIKILMAEAVQSWQA
jgi:hypothetical protein